MSETKIVTVTLNPSVDRTLTTRHLAVGYHNRTTDATRLDPAGRGVNISHALHRLQCRTHAVVLLGNDPTGRAYETLVADADFPVTITRRAGTTRSNITIVDAANHTETIIIEDCLGITEEAVNNVADTLDTAVRADDIIVFTGSIPKNLPADTYRRLVERTHDIGAKAMVHAEGETLRQALQVNPDLVVIRQSRAEAFFNYPVRSRDDVILGVQKLREEGAAMAMMVHIQTGGGAVLDDGTGIAQCDCPEVETDTGTYSGAVDALLAGYLAGYIQNKSAQEALEMGMAAAMYTISQPGNEFGTFARIQEHMAEIDATAVEKE